MDDSPPTAAEVLPDGPAWAAVLAAGVGCFAFGVITDWAEASKRVSAALAVYAPAGNLPGKAAVGGVIWGIVWAVLHWRWRGRTVRRTGVVAGVAFGLVALAAVATFPPVFELFGTR